MRMDLRVAGAHIVKKNGIMMVDFAIQAEREQNLSPHDAIRQACLRRRHRKSHPIEDAQAAQAAQPARAGEAT
jgi:hypothetical protein